MRRKYAVTVWLMITVLLLCFMTLPAYALNDGDADNSKQYAIGDVSNESTSTAPNTQSGEPFLDVQDGIDWGAELDLGNPTTDEILNWATTKGNQVIYMLQIFCQPFAIVIFIVAGLMTLIGCIGNSSMVGKGVMGMVLSVVIYAAVLYAPVILQTFVGWVAS